ncbi:MAG: hypothetical protein ACOCUF_02905 [Patescibacteria group bacterium]
MKCKFIVKGIKTLEYRLTIEGSSLIAKILIVNFVKKNLTAKQANKTRDCSFKRAEIKQEMSNWLKNNQSCSCPLRSFCVDLVVYFEGEAFCCNHCRYFQKEFSLTEDKIIESLPRYTERIEMVKKGLVEITILNEKEIDIIECQLLDKKRKLVPQDLCQPA